MAVVKSVSLNMVTMRSGYTAIRYPRFILILNMLLDND